jgi:hypothetical protein
LLLWGWPRVCEANLAQPLALPSSRWIAAGLDEATVARMAGDTVEQIHKTYLHEFERSRRQEEIPAKLVAGTRIRFE